MTIDTPSRLHLPALRALWKEAFGDSDNYLNSFEKTAFAIDRCRCVTIDNTAVAALYWFDCSYHNQPIAYLYAIATAKAYRGQGLCSALMEDTHRHLKVLGYEGTVLVPGTKELFRFYEKIGYQICSSVSEFSCSTSVCDAEVRPIDVNEYAQLRRKFLPKDGIIQENENLEYLQALATFYTGDDFLLAAQRDNASLYTMELLGNTDAAPAIVQALGCIEGQFRTPGTDIPFAMYHALRDGKLVSPLYFGLAFD